MMKTQHILIPVLAGALLWLGGCGSAPPIPSDKLASVETAIASAKDKEAQHYATMELMKAESKLTEAKALITKEEMDKASLLLEQALVDAKLAESKADAARADKQQVEMQETIDTLKKEVERK